MMLKTKKQLLISLFYLLFYGNVCGQELKISTLKLPESIHDSLNFVNLKPSFEPIVVSYSQNSFFVYFEPFKKGNIYSYQVKNLNFFEIETTNNYIFLPNLPNGDYELIIKNISNPKVKPVSQKFIIEPPIWLRWWFLPLLFLYGLILVAILAYFLSLYRLRQQLRLQAVRHELEIKALRAQMNPHFIFNSMNTIDAYILRKRFVEASDCLQKFSKLIRQILENSENQTISIVQELETLKLYIELEQERFSHSFSYQFDIQPELLEKDYQIPPLLIQPFVENAILHGIRHLTERKGKISLNLSISDSLLLCVITDNGIGRKASSEINQQRQESHKSMGVDITMERISGYQTLYGDKMETNITDLATGTRVEIKLPLNTTPDP